ncbi:MAG: hydantoinase/oxoprolinase N-terminal domain-containing protein [Anaerolineae bacterium]
MSFSVSRIVAKVRQPQPNRLPKHLGGTFTDLIYLDEATGEVGLTKASTTPHNFAIGVEDTLQKSGINVPDTTFFVHTVKTIESIISLFMIC